MGKSVTSITQKGQVTIPKSIREDVGLKIYEKVIIYSAGDHVEVYPTRDILDLAGTFKPKLKKSVLAAREALEKDYGRI